MFPKSLQIQIRFVRQRSLREPVIPTIETNKQTRFLNRKETSNTAADILQTSSLILEKPRGESLWNQGEKINEDQKSCSCCGCCTLIDHSHAQAHGQIVPRCFGQVKKITGDTRFLFPIKKQHFCTISNTFYYSPLLSDFIWKKSAIIRLVHSSSLYRYNVSNVVIGRDFSDMPEHIYTLQSLTGKVQGLQGNPCNENRSLQ